jgi:hypothetical protein
MIDLSPAAHAVLAAAIRKEYDLNPCDVSNEAARMASTIAASLRAVANDWRVDTEFIGGVEYIRASTLELIAAELEGAER